MSKEKKELNEKIRESIYSFAFDNNRFNGYIENASGTQLFLLSEYELYELVSQELDKAREEQLKEVLDNVYERDADDMVGNGYSPYMEMDMEYYKKIVDLTSKEDGNE